MKLWSRGATSKIAATATALAVTGAFGVGAYALTQDGAVFDPSGFTSAYGKDASDSQKGYQATPESTDSAANRHNDASNNKDRSAEENPAKDAFSELPNNGKGTTAVSVDANAKPGTSAAVDDPGAGGSDNGSGSGSAGNPTGPVIDNGGNGSDNTGGNGGDDNTGGGSTTPSNPGGSGDNGNGGSGNSGGGSGTTPSGPDSGAGGGSEKPAEEEKSDVAGTGAGLEDVIETVPDKKEPESSIFGEAITAKQFTGTANDVWGAIIEPKDVTEGSASLLYSGQSIDPWIVFCALDASFFCNDWNTYSWSCTKDEFKSPDMNSKLFYIEDKCVDSNGNEIDLSKNAVIPNDATSISITVHYRYNSSCEWQSKSVEIPICPARVYVLGLKKGSDDYSTAPTLNIVNASGRINASCYSLVMLEDIIGKGKYSLFNGDEIGYLIVDWLFNGKTPGECFDIESGRNTISARTVKKLDTAKYIARIQSYSVDDNDNIDPQGKSVYWQTLTGFYGNESAEGEVVVPNGIQRVDIGLTKQGPTFSRDGSSLSTDRLVLPKTVKDVDVEHGALLVADSFEVDSSNPKLTSLNGVLATKDTQDVAYMAIPLNMNKLDVPVSVNKISFSPSNHFEGGLTFAANSYDELPSGNYGALANSTLCFKNEDVLLDFLEANPSVVDSSKNNKLVISGTNQQVSRSYGLLSFDGVLLDATDSNMSIANLQGLKLAKGSLAGSSIETVIVDSNQAEFEEGCFDGAKNLKTVVCTPEQRDAVKRCLTGSSLAVITTSLTSNGYRYYNEKNDATAVLVEAPEYCDAIFTGDIGDGVIANKIVPFAFRSNESIHWVNIGGSVSLYGAAAFAGCSSLEGVVVGNSSNKDTVVFEADAFANCPDLRFFASNAENVSMVNSVFEADDNCALFAPTTSDGYEDIGFTSFNEESGITDFVCVDVNGCLVLYGATDGEAWLCLRAGFELPAQLHLPTSTVEIFSNAFNGSKCGADSAGFNIDFSQLSDLYFVDNQAFANSDLGGSVELLRSDNALSIMGERAFANCKLASFTSRANYLTINASAFAGCRRLETVTLSCSRDDARGGIASNAWFECDNLKSIAFTNESSAPKLTVYDPSMPFAFVDSNRDKDLKVNVPDSAKMSYLRSWLYSFTKAENYDDLYESIFFDHAWDWPTTEDVIAWTNETILATENKLRTMMGMETVDTPTFDHKEIVDGVVFKVDESGQASVVDVEYGVDAVDFTQIDTSRWTEISLQEDAFSNAADTLKSVVLSDKVKVIRSGAFDGCRNITVTLADSVPLLYGGSLAGQFDFGAANLKLVAAGEVRQQCLESWPRQMLGLDTDKALNDYVFDVYSSLVDWDSETAPTKSQVSNAVNEKLREQENRIREWFGMRALESNEAPTWAYDSPYGADDVLSDVEDEEGDRAIADGDAAESDPNEEDTIGKEEQSGESGSAGNAPGGNKGANADPTGTGTNDANAAAPEPPTPETPAEPEDATTE